MGRGVEPRCWRNSHVLLALALATVTGYGEGRRSLGLPRETDERGVLVVVNQRTVPYGSQ